MLVLGSVGAPFVFVSGRRIVAAACERIICVPEAFDISDMAIQKAPHVFDVVDAAKTAGEFLWLMPGPWKITGNLHRQGCSGRIADGVLFPAKNARPLGPAKV